MAAMPRHTVATPDASLVGKRVRLYYPSGTLLVSGEVTRWVEDGTKECSCDQAHGAALSLIPRTDDPELTPHARALLIRFVDRCIVQGIQATFPISRLRVEVYD